MEARAHVGLGDARSSLGALSQAEAAIEQAEPDGGPFGTNFLDAPRLAGFRGTYQPSRIGSLTGAKRWPHRWTFPRYPHGRSRPRIPIVRQASPSEPPDRSGLSAAASAAHGLAAGLAGTST